VSEVTSSPVADHEEGLPFHPRTVLVGVVRRRRFIIAFALGSAMVGLLLALIFGRHLYQAQSVLLYRPDLDGRGNDPSLTVQTQANIVLLDSNLEETRRRLDLPVSLKELQSACEVKTQNNTALLMIEVLWNSPDVAARIANTLRDVFVANHQKVRQSSAALEVQDLRARIDEVRGRLKVIDAKLQDFSALHGLVDVDKQTQNYLAELTSTQLLYEQARAEKQSIDMQLQNAEGILARSGKQDAPKKEALNDLNVRYARLRDAIHEDQSVRSNIQKLELAKLDMDRSKQLYQQGLIAKAEYDKVELAYLTEKEIALDTSQVKAWRDEIARLDSGMQDSGGLGSSKETMLKLFQLQLDQIAAGERVKALEQSLQRLQKKIDGLPKLQRDYLTFGREAEAKDIELKLLEEKLGRAERAQAAKSSEFVSIADATPPAFPAKSHRMLIFLGVSAFGTLLGLGVVLSRELLNTTVRSAGEAGVKVPIPLLGVVPQLKDNRLTAGHDEIIPEPYRALALHVRRTAPKTVARILFVAAHRGEGVSTIIANVAECLRREQQNVLIRTAKVDGPGTHDLRELLDNPSPPYDVLLLDGPPMLESIDSEVVAPSCDAAIIVIAAGLTPVSAITEAIARLRNTGVSITGAVLNRVDPGYL